MHMQPGMYIIIAIIMLFVWANFIIQRVSFRSKSRFPVETSAV